MSTSRLVVISLGQLYIRRLGFDFGVRPWSLTPPTPSNYLLLRSLPIEPVIVGSSIGGVLVLLSIAIVGFYIRRRKRIWQGMELKVQCAFSIPQMVLPPTMVAKSPHMSLSSSLSVIPETAVVEEDQNKCVSASRETCVIKPQNLDSQPSITLTPPTEES